MCDTFVALGSITLDKKSIFAKNSDRPPNESQYLQWLPARTYTEGETVKCTYISIPQVKQTHSVLLSQPFWLWGAEMGANEHGLVIGNEGIYSKVPANKDPALLGMDLVRLALERAVTPQEGVEVITTLLETYGQGGNCQQNGEMYYHNSYLLANTDEAWVLETIDRQWAARKVRDAYSISNVLSLSSDWDIASEGLVDFTIQNNLARSRQNINLSKDYSDFLYTTFSNARQRCQNTTNRLQRGNGNISIHQMIDALRDHGDQEGPNDNIFKNEVCMHAGFGPIRISQSTASMVVLMDAARPLVFATGTAAPCTSVFKPFWLDIALPDMGPKPTEIFDPETLFWRHEILHREVIKNYGARIRTYQQERDEMEARFIEGAVPINDASKKDRSAYAAACFQEAAEAEIRWLDQVRKVPAKKAVLQRLNNWAWRNYNREAHLE